MLPLKAPRAAAYSNRDPRLINLLGGKIGQQAKEKAPTLQAALIGSDVISCGAGITARGASPILALCRLLVGAAHDPGLRLEVYRGDVLALAVKSIGLGARLEINAYGTGFRTARRADAAPSMRQNRLPRRVPP